jgi:thymidine kinase
MSAPVISFDTSSCGYLDVIIGPMYSGKTSYLLRELTIFSKMGANVLYINHSLDDRSESNFSTHNPLIKKINDLSSKKTDDLFKLYDECKEYDVIGIDESQFFSGLKDFVLKMVEIERKRVIVTGLSGNFRRESFGEIISLIPCCDRITKLSSCCQKCAHKKLIKDAHFSYRLNQEEKEVLVGSSSEYIPLCRECYLHYKDCKEQ